VADQGRSDAQLGLLLGEDIQDAQPSVQDVADAMQRGGGMAMEFTRVISPVEDMEIWSASSDGLSFVISYENRSGPGLHGHPGFVASWRPIDQNRGAIKIGGSPFKTLADAEKACEAMLGYLTDKPE
jgi:hypothetical protein